MMTTVNERQLRTVYELPEQVLPPAVRSRWEVTLNEFLALADTLREAGHDVGSVLARISAITDAVDRAIIYDPARYITDNLLELEPAVVAERVRQAGLDLLGAAEMSRARQDFDARLAHNAAAELRTHSGQIVAKMRKTFDPALKQVQIAADCGLTSHTDTATLLDTADAKTLEAYRALTPAVRTLDRIASLRTQMALTAAVGPPDEPVLSFLATVDNLDQLDAAKALWRGEVEVVQHVVEPYGSAHAARIPRPRLGGPWLALLVAGYKVRLNDGDQATAVLAAAAEAA